ncbi:MAG: FG-GAP-like repeat-containing protein [Bacteroidales bacterium]
MDNDMDLVCLSGYFSTTIATIIENIGDGNFYTHEPFPYNPYCWRFLVSDLNNDSLPDIISSSVNNGVYILYNEGNYQLSGPVFIPVPLVGYDFVNAHCADLDNNGFNDLIITQTNAHFINLLFNDGNGNFVEDPLTYSKESIHEREIYLNCSPNPFSGTTKIWYKLESESSVQLNVYNFTGQLIKSYDEGSKMKGNHFVEFDATGLKSGIYFYSIGINGQISDSKKMTILK